MSKASEPLLLALDTSTRSVGMALYNGAQIIHEAIWFSHDHHTVELAPAIDDALKKADFTIKDLGAIALAIGPGSFTGLRISLALAKGLAVVRRIPLIGVPSLDILAGGQNPTDLLLLAALRAGRARFATGWYQFDGSRWSSTQEIKVLTLQDLVERINFRALLTGEFNREEREFLVRQQPLARLASPSASVRRPAILAELGWERWQSGQVDDPASLAPTYLHYNDPIPG